MTRRRNRGACHRNYDTIRCGGSFNRMTSFAVLLESYTALPTHEWGEEISSFMDEHLIDSNSRLHRQQGIVWDGLDRPRADRLGAYLIEKGFPAGLVEDADVAKFDTPKTVRNADPTPSGLEIEDIWEKKSMIGIGSIILAQVGYVEEKVDVGAAVSRTSGFNTKGTHETPPTYIREKVKEAVGWTLQIFHEGTPVKVVRIFSKHFNYDYQGMIDANKMQRFSILLNDIARILPYECLDNGYRQSMSSLTKHEDSVYKTLDQMIERARWAVTIRSVLGC